MNEQRTAQVIEQTGRNIDLAFQLMNEAIDDDDLFADIPTGETVVVLPFDDSTLTLQNLAMAARLADAGKPIYLRVAGGPSQLQLQMPNFVRWAIGSEYAGRLQIQLDSDFDTYVFDFTGGSRSTVRLPIGADLSLLVDPENGEVVGYGVSESLIDQLSERTGSSAARQRVDPADRDGVSAVATFISDLAPAA